jgi:hypothetical protein
MARFLADRPAAEKSRAGMTHRIAMRLRQRRRRGTSLGSAALNVLEAVGANGN